MKLLLTTLPLGALLWVVAASTGCAQNHGRSEAIEPSYRHAAVDRLGESEPPNQASPDGSR